MKSLNLFVLLLLTATLTPPVNAEELNFFKVMDSVEDGMALRSATGEIHELDLARRTAIISGFMYVFGPSTLADPLEVTMLGSDYGALELLRVGMYVEVRFLQSPSGRVGRQLIQVESMDGS